MLGEQDITDFTRGEWSKCVALVSQEPILFPGAPTAQLQSNLDKWIGNKRMIR